MLLRSSIQLLVKEGCKRHVTCVTPIGRAHHLGVRYRRQRITEKRHVVVIEATFCANIIINAGIGSREAELRSESCARRMLSRYYFA